MTHTSPLSLHQLIQNLGTPRWQSPLPLSTTQALHGLEEHLNRTKPKAPSAWPSRQLNAPSPIQDLSFSAQIGMSLHEDQPVLVAIITASSDQVLLNDSQNWSPSASTAQAKFLLDCGYRGQIDSLNSNYRIVLEINHVGVRAWLVPLSDLQVVSGQSLNTNAQATQALQPLLLEISQALAAAHGTLFWGESLWDQIFSELQGLATAAKIRATLTVKTCDPQAPSSGQYVVWEYKALPKLFSSLDESVDVEVFPSKNLDEILYAVDHIKKFNQSRTEAQAASARALSQLQQVCATGTSDRAQELLDQLKQELQQQSNPR